MMKDGLTGRVCSTLERTTKISAAMNERAAAATEIGVCLPGSVTQRIKSPRLRQAAQIIAIWMLGQRDDDHLMS